MQLVQIIKGPHKGTLGMVSDGNFDTFPNGDVEWKWNTFIEGVSVNSAKGQGTFFPTQMTVINNSKVRK